MTSFAAAARIVVGERALSRIKIGRECRVPDSDINPLTDTEIVQIELFSKTRILVAFANGHSVLVPAAAVMHLALREGSGYAASSEPDPE